ncbi:FAD linked oxidase protein [Ancylostoma ceylanicum]|uniref:D-2-hydroxyglutarate dehydrogenase, mitochondrial n=1 Tax=Ancylostoma ceylanicum TaxID=53326 RepID=A0A0D6LFD3_9BILA|nr:FAD linked oxidase protein [Ancylostoma ceylanicum]
MNEARILNCDAGFILEELDNKLAPHGYMMPLDLGAKGSCMIGGNVATSAGGIRLLRYGSLHAHLLGLTVYAIEVLPTEQGTILKLGSTHKKDNTSLHTPHLFLGSEGQLGVITRVAIGAVPKPASVQSAMLGVDTFESCCAVLRMARRHLSEILSSFEFLDREVMVVLDEALGLKPVLKTNPRFTLLAQSVAESAAMWRLRESAPLAVAADGFVFKNDVSLPLKHFYGLTEEVRARCSSMSKRIVTYGHLGDGNSHLNIVAKEYSKEVHDK